ncbi:ABC transporter permease [uncultured Paludibaculum sp.]|uniref:ABC transporter permease n=1 Tax=uncultured Paludibaculum sp. TaxID=1765020 RepID=UPI002AAB5380|nr:ABC transporter permease [uncultured Paludibaculum sp.]
MPLWSKLRNVFHTGGSDLNGELDEELQAHIAMRAEQFMEEGMPPAEARRQAQLLFGNTLLQRERTRDADVAQWLDALIQDLCYAARMMRHSPVLTGVIVLSLALGIGANTALFSITNAILFRPLPVVEPQRLYTVTINRESSASNFIWEDLRDQRDVFSSAFAWATRRVDASQGGEVRPLACAIASGALFRTLGLQPALGRPFTEEDDKPDQGGGDGPVAVLNHDYWTRAYGADTRVVGQTIRLDGKPFKIIGVAPQGFSGIVVGEKFDVLVPLAAEPYLLGPESNMHQHAFWWLTIVGRLAPGLSPEVALAQIQSLGAGVMERTQPPDWKPEYLKLYLNRSFGLESAARGLASSTEEMKMPVFVLNAVVILVLLIACANVTNLLLARTAVRRREIAVRVALGASRARIVRQMLTESLLLSAVGGLIGLAGAPLAARLLVQTAARGQTEWFLDLRPDATVLAFTALISLLCGLMFGVVPALRSSAGQPETALISGAGAAIGRLGLLRGGLVAVQVALAFVLLVGAGLFISTLRNLVRADLGFRPDGVVFVDLDLAHAGIAPATRGAFHAQLLERLRGMPGVESASASMMTPLAGSAWQYDVRVPAADGGFKSVHTFCNAVTNGFFATLGTPLLAGRDFDAADTANSKLAAIVNESFARQAFGGANSIGKSILKGSASPTGGRPAQQSLEIVGIVRDAKYRSIRAAAPPTIYLAVSQEPLGRTNLTYELRSSLALPVLVPSIRAAMTATSPRVSYTVRTLSSAARDSMRTERLIGSYTTIFGALALVLAAIGLYGVLAYSVNHRRGEIGIRVALGATPRDIRGWVVRQTLATVAIGAMVGIGLAAWSTTLVQSMLYGVQSGDPLVYATGLAILLFISVLAAYLPARRATRLDPVQALRHE